MDAIVARSTYLAPSGQAAFGGTSPRALPWAILFWPFRPDACVDLDVILLRHIPANAAHFLLPQAEFGNEAIHRCNSRRNSFRNGVLSCQVRAVTRLPSTTQGRSTYVAPALVASSAHLATVVTRLPSRQPAAAAISIPWQTEATGFFVSKKCRVISSKCRL